MLKIKKKKLLNRLRSGIVRDKLLYYKNVKKWNYGEIAQHCHISQQVRLTEIVQEYGVDLAESTLVKLLKGGIVTTEELINSGAVTDDEEAQYIASLKIHENTELTKLIAQLEAKNIDYLTILKKALEENK